MTAIGVIIIVTQIAPAVGYYPTEDENFVERFKPIAEGKISDNIIDEEIKLPVNAVLILTTTHLHGMADHRRVFNKFLSESIKNPIIVRRSYSGLSDDIFQLYKIL